jgi:hypothetical protein
MISADPVPVGEDSVWILPPQECEMIDHINVEGQGNTFSAYIARPKTSPTSAVVVLQELFGVGSWEVGKFGKLEVWKFWGREDVKKSILRFAVNSALKKPPQDAV